MLAGICLITCLLFLTSQEKRTTQFSSEKENDISMSIENSLLDDVQSIISDEETESFKKNQVVFNKNKFLFQPDNFISETVVPQKIETVRQLILIQHSDLPPPSLFV